MIRSARHVIMPAFMSVRVMAPASAAVPGWWVVPGVTCVAAYQPKGTASLAASYINLISPGTNDAIPVTGAPTFNAALGWVSVVGCTGLVAGTYTTTGGVYSVVVRSTGEPNYVNVIQSSDFVYLIATRGAGQHRYSIGTNSAAVNGRNGVYALTSQLGADQETGYFNGSPMATDWSATALANGKTLQCGPTTADVGWSIAAVAWYVGRLSAAQVATLSTAMAAL